jgi:hypothetical protein
MKCEDYLSLLDDYFDGTLDQKGEARLNLHVASCEVCAELYREMVREQELYTRYQRNIEVSPSMWAAIENRIKVEQPAKAPGFFAGLRERFAGAFSAPRLSPAFAAVLVVIAIGATVFVMSRMNRPAIQPVAQNGGDPGVSQPADNTPPVGTPPSVPKNSGKEDAVAISKPAPPRVPTPKTQVPTTLTPAQLVRDAEQKYLAAIAMLSRDVNKHRSQLDPMVMARFDASLAEIDRTIKETRQVVRQNPEDPIALQYLLAAYSKKVDVLREMTND